jgi:parallel beta-helix repeat protein
VTIKNGTLLGYSGVIDLFQTNNTTIENLTIKNLYITDPDYDVAHLYLWEVHNIIIRDCQFEFFPTHHKTAISTGNDCDFIVDNVEFIGGGTGIDFGGWFEPSNGVVTNSRFLNNYTCGILLQYSTNTRIANNVFTGSTILSDSEPERTVRNLTIEGNIMQEGAIHFLGTIESNIVNNQIINLGGGYGISMQSNMGCGDPGVECFYSTGNIIRNNTVMGNEYDLHHCDSCIGNTWEGNTCETRYGIEIPACQPETATAQEHLISIDSFATEIDQDAQLMAIWSWTSDTTGRSYKWYYIYKSSSQETYYELWWKNGQIIQLDSLRWPWMISEDNLPITESWIDSDSALVIADDMGGQEFRETNELQTVEMFLNASDHVTWVVRYRSQNDSVLNVFFDARKE